MVDVGRGRWAEGRAAEARGAVDVGRVDFGAAEGLASAWVDGDVGAAEGGEDARGVVRGVDDGGVAVAGADAEEGQGGVVRGDEDSEDVLGWVLVWGSCQGSRHGSDCVHHDLISLVSSSSFSAVFWQLFFTCVHIQPHWDFLRLHGLVEYFVFALVSSERVFLALLPF